MLYREYGKTGIKVSVLGFGAGRFPVAKRDFDMDRIVGILRHALDLGINYVDTAEAYSLNKSEVAVGKAIKGQRDQEGSGYGFGAKLIRSPSSSACPPGHRSQRHR